MKDQNKLIIAALAITLLIGLISFAPLIVKDIKNEADFRIPVTLVVSENDSIAIKEIDNYINYLNTNVTGRTKNSAIDKIGYDIVEVKRWDPPNFNYDDYNFSDCKCRDFDAYFSDDYAGKLINSIKKLNNTIENDGIVVIIVNESLPESSIGLTWPDRTFGFDDRVFIIVECQKNDSYDYNICKNDVRLELSGITIGFSDKFIEKYS